MRGTYLCALRRDSKFSLSMFHLQQNSNATTDLDAMTSEDVNSFPRSFILDPHHTQVPLPPGSARGSTSGGITPSRNCDSATSNIKHVGFAKASDCGSRARNDLRSSRHNTSKQQHQSQQPYWNSSSSRSGTACGTSSSQTRGRDTSAGGRSNSINLRSLSRSSRTPANYRTAYDSTSRTPSSMLLPLTSRQSNINNLHMPFNKSENNALPQSRQQESQSQEAGAVSKDASAPAAAPGRGGGAGCLGVLDKKVAAGGCRDLLTGPGIPYWNVYEYQDFHELSHGQPQLFDPLTDPHLHRESIILDSYNRLSLANPYFRRPNPLYHVR